MWLIDIKSVLLTLWGAKKQYHHIQTAGGQLTLYASKGHALVLECVAQLLRQCFGNIDGGTGKLIALLIIKRWVIVAAQANGQLVGLARKMNTCAE
nr:hypothetical protein [Bacterioplanes sanyensis]